MLNKLNFKAISKKISNNIMPYMPYIIECKSSIQTGILPLLTYSETCDIRDCQLNAEVVEKLVSLGKKKYADSEKTTESLFCICLAIGTIIKEYDWGIYYLEVEGMCEIANKIVG